MVAGGSAAYGASISGTVYHEDGTTPLTGEIIAVKVRSGSPCSDSHVAGTLVNQSDGTYLIDGLPAGTFLLRAENLRMDDGSQSDYVKEWWSSAGSYMHCLQAESFTVTSTDSLSGYDFQLSTGHTITGTVRDASGVPITGAAVDIQVRLPIDGGVCSNWMYYGGTSTDPANGTFILRGIPTTDAYFLANYDQVLDYLTEWYTGDPVDPSSRLCDQAQAVYVDASKSGIDFELAAGGGISGTVYETDGTTPINGGWGVRAYMVTGDGQDTYYTYVAGSDIGSDGTYRIGGLPEGIYVIHADPENGDYIPSYYDNTSTPDQATRISVVTGDTVTGRDFQLTHLTAYSGTHAPGIDLDDYGASTWTTSSGHTALDFWVKIVDYDGIADNGITHSVTVTYPDGTTTKTLAFQYRNDNDSAIYALWDDDIAQPMDVAAYSGDFVFRVEDIDGQWSQVSDNVQANPIAAPETSSFYPRYDSPQSIEAHFDDVYVNGTLYDDFSAGFDDTKWRVGPESVTISGGEAVLAKTWPITGGDNHQLALRNPESITSHAATVRLSSITGDTPDASVGGFYFHDGQGDVLATVSLRGESAGYSVIRVYWQGGHLIAEPVVPFQSLGPVSLGNRYRLSIGWNGTQFDFGVQGLDDSVDYSTTYIHSGTVSPTGMAERFIEVISWLTLNTTTPTFDWAEVPGSLFYRIRVYNLDDGTIYRGYASSPPYTLPPAILKPGGIYKYRIDAFRDHQWFEVDNKAGSDRNQTRIWVTAGTPAQRPYIEMGSWQGIKSWTSPRQGSHLSPWIEVYDAQGVPDNIKSAKVIFPDGTTSRPLYFVSRYNSYSGEYGTDYFGDMPSGTYTFVVEDRDGNVFEASEAFTSAPLPSIAPETLQPAQDAVITTDTLAISWGAVTGAKMYYVRIYDANGNVMLRKRVAHPTTTVSLPTNLFRPGHRYSYYVRAMDGFYEDRYQNESAPDWSTFNRWFTIAPVVTGTHAPDIDLDGWGAGQGQTKAPDGSGNIFILDFWVRVADMDGVPENIASVTVSHPSMGTDVMYLNWRPSSTEGYYYAQRQVADFADIPAGDYTFVVTDHQGNTRSIVDTVTPVRVAVPADTRPESGAATGMQPKFEWEASENAVRYMVRIYSGWNATLMRSAKVAETDYVVPPENQLSPQALYQYRVYAYHENPDDGEVDNYAINMATIGMMPHFWTQNTLDIDQDGVDDGADDYPYDPAASLDTDGDGYPDAWNAGYTQNDSTSVPQLVLDGLPLAPEFHVDANGDTRVGLEDILFLLRNASQEIDAQSAALEEAIRGLKVLSGATP